MYNSAVKVIIKGSITLFSLAIATFLGKKTIEDAKTFNEKRKQNGK